MCEGKIRKGLTGVGWVIFQGKYIWNDYARTKQSDCGDYPQPGFLMGRLPTKGETPGQLRKKYDVCLFLQNIKVGQFQVNWDRCGNEIILNKLVPSISPFYLHRASEMVSFLVIPLCVSEWVDWAGGDNEYIRSRKSPSHSLQLLFQGQTWNLYVGQFHFDIWSRPGSIISLFQQQLLHLLRTQYFATFQAQHIWG